MKNLQELAYHLDTFINPLKMEDTAINGIQVSNAGPITKIATAVTASLETIIKAAAMQANVLIVHHGIFSKNDPYPLSGIKYRKIKLLLDHNIALLCYHLPLDAHQEIGNNCKAAHESRIERFKTFWRNFNIPIGVIGTMQPLPFVEFKKNIEEYYGREAASVKVKDTIASVAIVSGAGEKSIKDAARTGADCFISGRVDEPVWDSAHEEHISFLGLGHYATETVGPQALATYIQGTFALRSYFYQNRKPFLTLAPSRTNFQKKSQTIVLFGSIPI